MELQEENDAQAWGLSLALRSSVAVRFFAAQWAPAVSGCVAYACLYTPYSGVHARDVPLDIPGGQSLSAKTSLASRTGTNSLAIYPGATSRRSVAAGVWRPEWRVELWIKGELERSTSVTVRS